MGYGEEPNSVKASLTNDKAELSCASGAVVTTVNDRQCALGYDQRAKIFCEDGRVASDSQPADPKALFLDRYANAYKASLDDFLSRVVETGQPPPVSVRDSLLAALLARCADEAAKSGVTQAVEVPPLSEQIKILHHNNMNMLPEGVKIEFSFVKM